MPEQWKESVGVRISKEGDRLIVVIVEARRYYRLCIIIYAPFCQSKLVM